MDSLTGRGQAGRAKATVPAARPLVGREPDPFGPYRGRARRNRSLRRRELGRYELGRYELGRWALHWLLQRGPAGIDI